MSPRLARAASVDAVVAAPPSAVWAVVSDVTRVGEWSAECVGAQWLGGASAVAPGARFRGRNRAGRSRWSRECEVLAVDAGRELVWRTVPTRLMPDTTEWRLTLTPADFGTRITQSYQLLKMPAALDLLFSVTIPAHRDRTGSLRADLAQLGEVAAREPVTA